MAGTDTRAVISVEVLVEQKEIAPVRVILSDANLNATMIIGAIITKKQLDEAKLKGSKCFQKTDSYNVTFPEEEKK